MIGFPKITNMKLRSKFEKNPVLYQKFKGIIVLKLFFSEAAEIEILGAAARSDMIFGKALQRSKGILQQLLEVLL